MQLLSADAKTHVSDNFARQKRCFNFRQMSILFSKAAGAFADCDEARQRDGAKQRRHQDQPDAAVDEAGLNLFRI